MPALDPMAERWHQDAFIDRLDEWIELEDPPEWLRVRVTNWVLSRIDDPFSGMKGQPGFDNLWFGVVLGSLDAGQVVGCSLWVHAGSRVVRCDRIATLSWPVE